MRGTKNCPLRDKFRPRFIEVKLHLKVNKEKTVASYMRGVKYLGYYHLANMRRFLTEADEWLRRRLRMCIWKSWKRMKTRIANLLKCGVDKYQAYMWGNSRLEYWRIVGSYILCRAITSEKLSRAGYSTLMGSYLEWHPKIGTAICGTACTVV